MNRKVQVKSLAKINLDLRVLHKRPDGFHEIRTVFQTISLADTLAIEYEPARRTSLEIADDLNIPDNLVLRAANAVLDAARIRAKIRFTLKKNIPMGGGLGGGSSNAAAVLLALPVLAGKSLPFEELLEIGAQLGSDVPFFLTGGTALAVDRGTEIYSLPDIAEEPILVVASNVHVATGPAYQALGRPVLPVAADVRENSENWGWTTLFHESHWGGGETRELENSGSPRLSGVDVISGSGGETRGSAPASTGLTAQDLLRKINIFQTFVRALSDTRSAKEASAFSANDFEPVVFGQHPLLKTLSGKLRKAAEGSSRKSGPSRNEGRVRMTGSGSALFALFRSREDRDRAERSLKQGRMLEECRVIPAGLVSRRSYQNLWRRQLSNHLRPVESGSSKGIWPPQSRYAR
jgi:4-diphosphocytidyl-2C-methyl-D-erythritol kinase